MSDVAYDPNGSFNAGYGRVSQALTDIGRTRAGRSLSQGNPRAAANALYGAGDLSGGQALEENVRQQGAAQAQATLRIARALREAKERGQDPVATLDTFRPDILRMGVDENQFSQLRTVLQTDQDALDTIERLAGAEADKWNIRESNGDLVRVNERTGVVQTLQDNPDRPVFIPGVGFLLPPSGGAAAGSPGQAAPVTGGAIGGGGLWSGGGQPAAPVSGDAQWQRQIQQESGGRQFGRDGRVLTSPAGAFGVAQLMPETAAELAPRLGVSVEQLRSDPALNERAGRLYLEDQLQKYGGNQALALAAYNAGPGRVDEWVRRFGDPRTGEVTTDEWISRIPFGETRAYVGNILSGSEAPVEAQGDVAGAPQQGVQPLGGGWALQPMQTPSDLRAERAESRAQSAEQRARAAFERNQATAATLSPQEVAGLGLPEGTVAQRRPDGTISIVARGGERFTEGQRLSAAFYHRAVGATRNLDRLSANGGRPSAAVLAFGEGRVRENALSPQDRQWVQASRDWLAPILRRDTGAAVSPGELVTYMGTYIPNPTDDPATLAQKAESRRRAQEGLRGTAGGAYEDLLQTLGQSGGGNNRRRTNAPGLPFDLNQTQLQYRQRLVGSGAAPNAPLGSVRNPYYTNPADERSSLSNYQQRANQTGREVLVITSRGPAVLRPRGNR